MMTAAISSMVRRTVAALVCLTGAAFLVNAIFAQPPQKSPSADTQQKELVVVPLKHASAMEVLQALTGIFSNVEANLGMDQRSNSIILAASAGKTVQIKDLIAKLDVPATPNKPIGSEVRVFSLRNINPDKAVETAVKLVVGARGLAGGNVAIDPVRNQVVVSADTSTLDAVEAILTRLDIQSSRRPSPDMQLRVVWLVNWSNPDDYGPPPDDLKEVLPALAKIGIDKPRLAAQTLINMTPNSEFRVSGTHHLGNLSITGHFSDRSDPPGLNISLNAKDTTEICNISTEISAPIGHFVVLGVTPTRSMTSVFVVQVLPKETIAPRK